MRFRTAIEFIVPQQVQQIRCCEIIHHKLAAAEIKDDHISGNN